MKILNLDDKWTFRRGYLDSVGMLSEDLGTVVNLPHDGMIGAPVTPDASVPLRIEVEGCGVLAGFGSANPVTDEDYTDAFTASYRGRAMAIIRSGYESGEVRVEVSVAGMKTVKAELLVV